MSETISEELGSLRAKLDRWRRQHGGPGKRIPGWVWQEAAAIAAVEGVWETAGVLRLARSRLEGLIHDPAGARSQRPARSPPAFVELEVTGGESIGTTIELESRSGDRMRVVGASPAIIALLAAALLEPKE
jgi:hypothetical protein